MLAVLAASGFAAEETLDSRETTLSGSDLGYAWTDIIQRPTATSGQQHRLYFESFEEALANESYDEAETTAKLMVELASRSTDVDELKRSRSLQNLALAQQLGRDYEAAILNYLTAISIVARHEGMLSESLIAPLSGLGVAYIANGPSIEAFRTFDRALNISNVNQGPHSLDQVPILNAMMLIHLDQGDTKSVLDFLDRIYLLHTREFSPHSDKMLPVLYQKAELLNELGLPAEERAAYRQIARIIRQHRGKSDIELIEPYHKLGRNLLNEMDEVKFRSAPTTGTAESYLKKALSIAEENPEADWLIRNKCLLALADYYTRVELYARAHQLYQQAWELLSSNDSYLQQRATDLERTVPISRSHPHKYANFEYNPDSEKIDPNDYLEGILVVRFTVSRRGRVKDLELIEADPPEFVRMERRVRRSLKDFVYRPRNVDGSPVDTENQIYRHDYFYLESEYAASRSKTGKLNRPRPPHFR